MAEVLRRALWGEIVKPADSIQVPLSGRKYRIPVERLKRYVDDVRRRGRADDDQQLLHYAAGRERLATLLAQDARRQKEEAGGSPTDAETARAARSAEVRAFCDEVWPARDAAAVVFDLWTQPDRLARAARGILDDDEQALLGWSPAPRSVRTAPWTDADAVLVDEVAGLLERTPGYGHVVLDEAQDLSPMQCRAVARRLAAGSLTVLGDLAQATSPWSPSDWQETLAGLGRPATVVRPAHPRLPGARRGARLRQPPAPAHRPGPAGGDGGALGARLAHRPAGVGAAGPLTDVVAELAAAPGSDRRRLRRRRGGRGGRAADRGRAARGRAHRRRRRRGPGGRRPGDPGQGAGVRRRRRAWTPPRSWPRSRAGCTASTSSSPGR